MLESSLERRLRLIVENRGGMCLKFVTPGKNGAPDREILMPGARAIFVETKTPKGVLKPIQRVYHEELRARGFKVFVIWTVEQLINFVDDEL